MAWSVVQSKGSNSDAGGSNAITYTSNVSSGTKLICIVSTETTVTTAVKDAAANSMTQVGSVAHDGNSSLGTTTLWAMDTPAGDVGAKPTLTATPNDTFISMVIQEVSGLAVGNSLAAMVDGTAGTSNGVSGTNLAAGSYSSTASNEYLVAVYGDDSNVDNSTVSTVTGSTTYTIDSNSQEGNGAANATLSYGNSTNGAETATFHLSAATSNSWSTILVAFKLASGVAAPNGTVQPRATVPVPRRYPARVYWRGSAPFLGFVSVAAPKRLPPVPRRTAARGVWAGSKPFLGFVAVPAPPQQPRLLPRRYPARGVWRGSAPFLGFVAVPAPRQEPPVPRRYPSRAVIRGSAPFLGFVAVPAPLRLPPVPRRYPSRAVIQFTPVTTTNALPVVASVSGVLPRLTVNRTEVMSRVTGRVVRR